MTLDLEKSKEVAKKIKAKPKRCFYNAFKALDYLPPEAMYIEGWVLKLGLAIEHAWINLNGAIIDPTLYHDPPAKYYPGMELTVTELLDLAAKYGDLPVAYRLFETDKYPAYKEAFDQVIADSNNALNERATVLADKPSRREL